MNDKTKKNDNNFLAALSEEAIANKMALAGLTIIGSIISLAYMVEVIKGSRTFGYVAVVVVLAVLPMIIGWINHARKSDSKLTRHIILIGFALLYGDVLFTAGNNLVFTYALPMLVVTTLYMDKVYSLTAGIGVIILNLIDVVIRIKNGAPSSEMPVFEIQVLLGVVFVIYIMMVISTMLKYQNIRAAILTIEKDKTTEILDSVLSISDEMIGDIDQVVSKMDILSTSMETTLDAMSEVQSGATETADSVQAQLQQTQEIQGYTAAVENASDVIKENLDKTTEAVSEGQKCMEDMTTITAASIETSERVTGALKQFKETTDKMNQITELINSVADQTSLLALNASIEAARAGEAGRGFSVVATEISQLASQSSEATDNIVGLINDISGQLETVISAINNMVEDNNKQAEAAKRTGDAFETIVASIDEMKTQSGVLAGSVDDLTKANNVIVDSVSTISAISEEVSAHSNETYSSSQKNQEIVKEVDGLVESLNNNAKILTDKTK